MYVLFTGRVLKIEAPTTFGSGSTTRKFWCEELNRPGGPTQKPNKLIFEVFTSSRGASPNFACCEDLDQLSVGHIVRFTYEPRGQYWRNKKNGSETIFLKLQVTSRIERLASRQGITDYVKDRPSQPVRPPATKNSQPAADEQPVPLNVDPDAIPF